MRRLRGKRTGKPKNVTCPKCGQKVAHYDGRQKINIVAGCRACWKRVVFHVDTGKTELKPWPQRVSGGGLTFY